jgi:hypothetical protein
MSLREQAEAIATGDQQQAGKLKRELAAERKAHEAARKELADLHSAYDLIENATQVNAKAVAKGRKLRRGKATSVFCASDWHCEEHVEPEVIDHANSFDLDEADRRIRRTFRKFVLLHNVQQHIAKVGDAVLWLGGDLINGYIHAELEESNFLGPAEAVQWVTDRVAGGIDYLLAELNCPLRVVCNYGNHGRATVKPRASTTAWPASTETSAACRGTSPVACSPGSRCKPWTFGSTTATG